jgi:hypothetical protein
MCVYVSNPLESKLRPLVPLVGPEHKVSRDDGNVLVDRSVPGDFANGHLPNLHLPLGWEVTKVVEAMGALGKRM